MPMYWLLRMKILTGSRYWAAVDISWMFIKIEASPAMSTTSASGWAICTPIAAGRPYPTAPTPPQGTPSQASPPQPPAPPSHPMVRLVELEELRRPHLMLADLGGDVHVALAGQRVQSLDRVLRLDQVAPAPVVTQAIAGMPGFDGPPPPGV